MIVRAATCLLVLLAVAPAGAQDEGDEELPWICVPDENRRWQCGRGTDAPTSRPVPPPRQPEEPPGYRPPGDPSRLPGYLLAPGADTTTPRRLSPLAPSLDRQDDSASGEPVMTGPAPASASPGESRSSAPESDAPATAAAAEDKPEAPARADTAVTQAPERQASPGDNVGAIRFGIQLMAAREPGTLDDAARRLSEAGVETYRRQWRDEGGTWHVLMTGRFSTVAEASRALASLPDGQRPAGAWIRGLDNLRDLNGIEE